MLPACVTHLPPEGHPALRQQQVRIPDALVPPPGLFRSPGVSAQTARGGHAQPGGATATPAPASRAGRRGSRLSGFRGSTMPPTATRYRRRATPLAEGRVSDAPNAAVHPRMYRLALRPSLMVPEAHQAEAGLCEGAGALTPSARRAEFEPRGAPLTAFIPSPPA